MKNEGSGAGSASAVRSIETRSSVCTLREDGVFVQRFRAGARQTLDDAKEDIAAMAVFAKGKRLPCLVDGRAAFGMEAGVREYYGGPEAARNTSALALLVGSGAARVAFNLFISLNKPRIPTRMFTDEGEAIQWLTRVHALLSKAGG